MDTLKGGVPLLPLLTLEVALALNATLAAAPMAGSDTSEEGRAAPEKTGADGENVPRRRAVVLLPEAGSAAYVESLVGSGEWHVAVGLVLQLGPMPMWRGGHCSTAEVRPTPEPEVELGGEWCCDPSLLLARLVAAGAWKDAEVLCNGVDSAADAARHSAGKEALGEGGGAGGELIKGRRQQHMLRLLITYANEFGKEKLSRRMGELMDDPDYRHRGDRRWSTN